MSIEMSNRLTPKRLHEMNDLREMGRFSLPVYLGATGNVLFSVFLFYWLHGRTDGNLAIGFPAAVGLVLCNLAPVVFLRAMDRRAGRGSETSEIGRMNFFTDQHRSPPGFTPSPAAISFSG